VTLTIDLPEEFAARIATLSEAERNRYAVAALSGELSGVLSDAITEALCRAALPVSEDDLVAAVREGIADAEAGRSVSLDEYADEVAARRRVRDGGAGA
jgi:predicted transcriptional regulator